MTRNMILNFRRHAVRFPLFMLRLLLVTILTFIRVIICGPLRLKNITMIMKGFIDGLLNKTGPYKNDGAI